MRKPLKTSAPRVSIARHVSDITEWFSDHDTYLSDVLAEANIELGFKNNHRAIPVDDSLKRESRI